VDAEIPDLLAHADWLRGLARRLVGYAAADDAVQDTYVAALHAPPNPELPPRPWLGRVLRNVTRMGHRSATRRTRREDAVAAITAPTTGVDDAVARAETFRMLVELVLGLDEPYRTTVVRHYFDGDTFAAIARRDGVPEATVRGRHKLAVERLRSKLDAKTHGDRSAWVATLAPIAAPPSPSILIGALVMNKILTVALVILVAGGVAWKLYPHADVTPTTTTTSPSHHVTQFASPEARTQLVQRIAAAAQTRLEASLPPVTTYTSTPAPQLPPLPPPPVIAASDLDKDTLRRAMHEVVPFLVQCFEAAMPTIPANELSIRAHLTITGDRDVGAIIDAKQLFDADQKPLPPKFDDCLRSTLQTLELPPLGDGSSVEIDYPFTFRKAVPDGSGSDDGDDGDDGGDDD
jgi:RNA polymerase sigma factor (sigma-70 family)